MTIGVEAVLRAQGTPPSAGRGARVRAAAEWAVREGVPLLRPAMVMRRLRMERVSHSGVHLAEGGMLSGTLATAQLAGAREVVVVAATVGAGIGDAISEAARESASRALALEGVATAALEAWVAEIRDDLTRTAVERGWRTSPGLSPGMEGWPLEAGQRGLFAILAGDGPVRLLESGMMWPRHSLSFVVGQGLHVSSAALPCDWCGARARCRHRPDPAR